MTKSRLLQCYGQGLLIIVFYDNKPYFLVAQVEKLALFVISSPEAMRRLNMSRDEFVLWRTLTSDLPSIKLRGERLYFRAEDIERLKEKLSAYMKFGAALRRYGIDWHQLQRAVDAGTVPSIIVGRLRYVLREKVKKMVPVVGTYSTGQVARRLDLTVPQVKRLAEKGMLPCLYTNGGKRRFLERDLRFYTRYMRGNKKEG